MQNGQETPRNSKTSQAGTRLIHLYTAECGKCFKWRVIPTQEEYEDIRSRFIEEPFFCDRKPDFSCDDPADIEYDATRTWVIDKPNIPKTPKGFKRQLVLRKDFSKLDPYYITPMGKKVRCRKEVSSFLEANPDYEGVSVSDFNFSVPKVMTDTVPEDVEIKGSASGNKRIKTSEKVDDVSELLFQFGWHFIVNCLALCQHFVGYSY